MVPEENLFYIFQSYWASDQNCDTSLETINQQ